MKKSGLVLGMCVLASLAFVCQAWASVAAEWQFNGDVSLSAAPAGASTSSQLLGSSAYSNGSTGLTGWNSYLQSGYVSFPNQDGTGGLVTVDSDPNPDSNAQYRDYFGREGIGTAGGTFYGVYQPTGWAWNFGNYRHTIAMSGSEGGNGDIWIYFTAEAGYGTPPVGAKAQLSMRHSYSWTAIDTQTSFLYLDPAKWYFIAASWKEGIAPSVYIREMNPTGAASSPAGITGVPTPYYWNYSTVMNTPAHEPLVLGTRYNYEAMGSESANGNIAWAQFLDSYTAPGQFDAVFTSLSVPEPISMVMMLGGLVFFVRRNRA